MCGIAGYLTSTPFHGTDAFRTILDKMATSIKSRGPDGAGSWWDEPSGIGLAHRRLAIVDLSPAGSQPMTSASGRFVVAYNGEIYNHGELRDLLEREGRAPNWRGHSDTETLLAGFDAWGIEGTLAKAIGMFAIALWDKQEASLTLIRDRLGEKPLYYGLQGDGPHGVLLFGSELKALKQHPAFSAGIDRNATCLLLRHNYIPAPYSIYERIHKLPPGCLLTINARQGNLRLGEPRSYWSLPEVIAASRRHAAKSNPEDLVDELDGLLRSAVKGQMMADVPLGAFLSGGIDSSTIVALMQAQSSQPVKTFTIGFDETGYDEAVHAKAVASHLGTDHTELYVKPEEALGVIPKLPALYDEPFSDSSQIPTFLVSRLAREKVTVSLSGDAGDELFGGYTRYSVASGAWKKLSYIPHPVRALMGRAILAAPPSAWDKVGRFVPGLKGRAGGRLGDKLHKGAGVLSGESIDALYMGLISHWNDPESVVLGGREPSTNLTGDAPHLRGLDPIERMMALDTISYLPGDILAKVDRASMGVSLESRVPLLDHRVVEFAWRLPLDVKLRDGQGKWVLRKVLERYVPAALFDRPKMGFGIPLDRWLRGPLKDWAAALLDEGRLLQEGYFDPSPIRIKWEEHLAGSRNWAYHLWDILMFQAWLEQEHA